MSTSTPRFTFDGDTFDLLRSPDDWTIEETIAIEDHFGRDTEELSRTRRFGAVLWVSVHRARPAFTLAEAVRFRQGAVEVIPETPVGQAVTDAASSILDGLDVEPDGVVLTPTSAGTEPGSPLNV